MRGVILGALGVMACGVDPAPPVGDDPMALPEALRPTGDQFMVAVIPDTQIYAMSFPETFDRQIKWIADHAEEYRIVFVSHVGDIVQDGDRRDQWAVARAAYDWLDDLDIPHGFSVAGHDVGHGGAGYPFAHDNTCSVFANTDCDATLFREHFGPERYRDRAWFLGTSPSEQSNAQRVRVGDLDLLFLHLPQDAPRAEVDWAHEILDANPGTLAHLTTHRYLFDYRLTDALPSPLNLLPAGRFNALTYLFGGQSVMYTTGLTAQELFDELVSAHPNVWSVHCGHVDAEFQIPDTNGAGLPVQQVLADYQDMAEGGGGWLRLLRYRPSDNQVDVITFSTETGELRENGAGYEHSLDILERYKDQAASSLEPFGFTQEEADALLAEIRAGGPTADAYRDSLYRDGRRDSQFVFDVDFKAYVEASR